MYWNNIIHNEHGQFPIKFKEKSISLSKAFFCCLCWGELASSFRLCSLEIEPSVWFLGIVWYSHWNWANFESQLSLLVSVRMLNLIQTSRFTTKLKVVKQIWWICPWLTVSFFFKLNHNVILLKFSPSSFSVLRRSQAVWRRPLELHPVLKWP